MAWVPALVQQGVQAQLGQGHGGSGDLSAGAVGRAADLAGPGLEVGGQGVAHAGHGEAHRGLGDDVGVHQHHVGVGGEEQVLLKHPRVGVDDGQGGAGRVGGGDGGADEHGGLLIKRHGLSGVQGLAAADADDQVAALGVHDPLEAVDLVLAALAVEEIVDRGALGAGEPGVQGGLDAFIAGVGDEHQRFGAVALGVGAQLAHLAGALDVLAGVNHDFCHCMFLLYF